ncbi:MAG TPA: sigma-70 family RNA polymerase sigma factor, partial [Planctomycetota bacterium]|nr:sigma-70 family RNA polymerase sigma factor [Planctomycetota bacterium]
CDPATPVRSLTDEERMLLVKEGDVDVFAEIVERYKGVVFNLALSILRSREDAEEAAQDAFLKLFRARHLYDADRPLEPWLLRIAGNACRDLLRRRRASALPVVRDDVGENLAALVADIRADGRESRALLSQAIRHELEQLSDKYRVPLELKYRHGFTNQQIAEAVGISVSNVKVRVARAKDVLESRLERILEG